MDTGDHVIVVNAKGVRLTGGKEETKVAYRHSGYPGGLTATKYGKLLAEKPAFAVEKAIRGMLPKNRLGRAMFKKLQVYAGPEHPHRAQKPEPLRLGEIPRWEGLPKPEDKPARSVVAPEDAEPAAKPTPAKRATAKPPAKASTAAGAAKKTTAKKTTAKKTTAKRTTSKASTSSTSAKPAAKRTTARRTKKEE
jgi:hypothetical protein